MHHPNTWCVTSAQRPGTEFKFRWVIGGILGDQYIGTGAEDREPQLSEFSKAAIALKMKLHTEAEKPCDKSRKEIARCDNLYIKNCLQEVQKLRDNWIGDDNQKQSEAPKAENSKPAPNYQTWSQCCCFSCLKIARKVT